MKPLRDRVFKIANDKGYNPYLVLRVGLYSYYKCLYGIAFNFRNHKELAVNTIQEKIKKYGYDFILSHKDIMSACKAMREEV